MIVAFVIDTSPSMGKSLGEGDENSNSMSRLDLAKMAVEEVVKKLKKRLHEHNSNLQQMPPKAQESFRNIGLGFAQKDEYLLLSTAPQYQSQSGTNICGAGGRLLVGFGMSENQLSGEPMGSGGNSSVDHPPVASPLQHNQHGIDSFQRELKRLKATEWPPSNSKQQFHNQSNQRPQKFLDDAGGAMGLNIAVSAGLKMLSRYRLKFKATENFGMGRLPSSAILNPTIGGASAHALQPACLIVITDGACLSSPPSEGGGALKLNFSTQLRDFYQEPFRWDQRIFCLGVGGNSNTNSTQFLHPHLRTLCEVTGGSHMMLRSSSTGGSSLSHFSDMLVNLIAPPLPRNLPLQDPISLLSAGNQQQPKNLLKRPNGGIFVNGGPVVTFQALEPDMHTGKAPPKHRAGIYYVPITHGDASSTAVGENSIPHFQPPVWCIPESFFPSKKLDSLPPRPSQPCLLFSRYPSRLGSKCFEPSSVMKALARLDQLVMANLKLVAGSPPNQQSRFLKRDVYICEWISVEGKKIEGPSNPQNVEYCPVLVAGAGRPTLSDGEGNYLSIGILHAPQNAHLSNSAHSTLTLLPPEPHVLLPLLIRAVESEHRALKKAAAVNETSREVGLAQKQAATASRTVHLDESWRNEFRAYLFRLPPYYQNALKRSLRSVLPASAHSLLNTDSNEGALASQCFSKICLQKIRQAEQMAKITNERLERQEAELRRRGMPNLEKPGRTDQHQHQQSSRSNIATETPKNATGTLKFGQYDPRCSVESYLAALRQMPAPWKVPSSAASMAASNEKEKGDSSKERLQQHNAMDALGDLPGSCLMAYYESRRRWIFGGSGISIRGLHVDGVNNDGSNVQRCGAEKDKSKESLLSFAGVGVSEMNATTTAKMGDYKERLLWSRAPVVGYGSNDSTGVSATTSQNGAPVWSVDNDAMPLAFFDARTGEFVDSVQNRVRARLFVNFGNPYKDKRADSLIPEEYLSQRPKKGVEEDAGGPMTPPTSPPHDTFSVTEGEGEAVFAGKPTSRTSPRRADSRREEIQEGTPQKRPRPSPEKNLGQPPPPSNNVESKLTDLERSPPQPRTSKLEKPKDEKQPAPPQPPPPPRRRPSLLGAPPPPPPKAPPSRKRPPPPPTPSSTPTKRPPPPKSQSASPKPPPPGKLPVPPPKSQSASPKPPPPGKLPAPPPPSRAAPPAKRPSIISEASSFDSQTSDVPPKQSIPQQGKPRPDPSEAGLDLQSPDVKPNVNLPPGWMCVWSKSQRRWYFFNTKNNKSVWQWPPP